MIEYISGDIFKSPAQVIVNTVNTVGVMGKGLALTYKKKYPDMFEAYQRVCEKKQLKTGKLMLYYAPDHWILLFPTKENWRFPAKLEYIESGLMKFVQYYAQKNITSIAFPRLGCGNGELNWDEVKPLMEKHLKPLPIEVYIYLGKNDSEAPEHEAPESTIEWLRNNAKDMSFNGVKDDISYHTSLVQLKFICNGKEMAASYHDSLIIEAEDGTKISISEDRFFMLWDKIRQACVFPSHSESEDATCLYALLAHLGYLSSIKIQEADAMVDGFQLNEGAGRAYALKENL